MDAKLKSLRLRQMDAKLKQLPELERPSQGWIRAIRTTLGMSASQLAARLGVTQQAVADLEKREVDGSVTLASLTKAADALDCDVIYALRPREGLTETVQKQAHRRAKHILGKVAHTMRLEAQQVATDEHDRQIDDAAAELVRSFPRSLWDPCAP